VLERGQSLDGESVANVWVVGGDDSDGVQNEGVSVHRYLRKGKEGGF
jgi:hypothetical protein